MRPGVNWASCHAAGMTALQAAEALGRTVNMAYHWAKTSGNVWPKRRLEPAGWQRQPIVQDMPADGSYLPLRADDCRRLWAAVMLRMWFDAVGPVSPSRGGEGGSGYVARQAQAWFRTRDGRMVCDLAGMDYPAVIRRLDAVMAAVAQAEVAA